MTNDKANTGQADKCKFTVSVAPGDWKAPFYL